MKTIMILVGCFMLLCSVSCETKKEQEKTVQLIWWGDIYNDGFARKLVQRYNEISPETKVSLITAQDYWIKLQTMIAGGTSPDIFLLHSAEVYELADKGALLSLDDYKKDSAYTNFQKDTWGSLRDQITYKDHLYAIPIWTNSIGIFYNKDLFDKAGVEYPSNGWTFDELLEKAKLLTLDTDNDGKIDQYGFGGFRILVDTWYLEMLIKAFGGELYSKDMKKCLIDTPGAIEAVRWAVELMTKHHVSPTPSDTTMKAVVSIGDIDLFQMRKVAMVYWGRWYIDVLSKKPDLRWGVAPYPNGKKKVMFSVPIYLGISSATKIPEASWKFVKFVMGEHGQKILSLGRTDISVLRSVSNSPEFLNYAGREDANKIFLDMLEYSETPVYLSGTVEWKQFAELKFDLVVLGKLSVEEACRQIAREFEKYKE